MVNNVDLVMNEKEFLYSKMSELFLREYLIKFVDLFYNNVQVQAEKYIFDSDQLNFQKYIHPIKNIIYILKMIFMSLAKMSEIFIYLGCISIENKSFVKFRFCLCTN